MANIREYQKGGNKEKTKKHRPLEASKEKRIKWGGYKSLNRRIIT
jgi:hypothetical protein